MLNTAINISPGQSDQERSACSLKHKLLEKEDLLQDFEFSSEDSSDSMGISKSASTLSPVRYFCLLALVVSIALGAVIFIAETAIKPGIVFGALGEEQEQPYHEKEAPMMRVSTACAPEDLELSNRLNDFRRQNGVPNRPISAAMIQTARLHADHYAQTAQGLQLGTDCHPLHSWGRGSPWGQACCFPGSSLNDWHRSVRGAPNFGELWDIRANQQRCMTNKPFEIRNWGQTASEISALALSAEEAFDIMAQDRDSRRAMLDTSTCSLAGRRTHGCASAPTGNGRERIYHCWFTSLLQSRDSCPRRREQHDQLLLAAISSQVNDDFN